MDNLDTLDHNATAVTAAFSHNFWDVVFSSPLLYLGYVFAFVAAIAFLVFFRGFISGLPHIFLQSSHEEHQHHHKVRVTWGLMMLIFIFILWEVVRFVLGGIFGLFGT